MSNPTRLLIVDDHQVVIDGLRLLLMGVADLEITGAANDGPGMWEQIEQMLPEVIILDVGLPGDSGITLLKALKDQYPTIRVIIFSGNTPQDYVYDALEAGADGVITKNASREELIEAIRVVEGGGNYFSKVITEIVMNGFQQQQKAKADLEPVVSLSDREIDIIRLFAGGFTYKEIAAQLDISRHTVESHKINILKKTGVKTVIEMVTYAIRHQLIEA